VGLTREAVECPAFGGAGADDGFDALDDLLMGAVGAESVVDAGLAASGAVDVGGGDEFARDGDEALFDFEGIVRCLVREFGAHAADGDDGGGGREGVVDGEGNVRAVND